MKKFEIFDFFADEMAKPWKLFLVQGLLFISFGALILLFPMLLVAIVATFFIVLGAIFLALAWQSRYFRKKYYRHIRTEFEDLV